MKNLIVLFVLGICISQVAALSAQSTTVGVVSVEYKCYERNPGMSFANIDNLFMTRGNIDNDFGTEYYDAVLKALKRSSEIDNVKLRFSEDELSGIDLQAFKGMTASAVKSSFMSEKMKQKSGMGEPDEDFYEQMYAYADELDARYLAILLVEGTYDDTKGTKKKPSRRLFVGPIIIRAFIFDTEELDTVFEGSAHYGASGNKSFKRGLYPPATSGMSEIEMTYDDAQELVEKFMERVAKDVAKYETKLKK